MGCEEGLAARLQGEGGPGVTVLGSDSVASPATSQCGRRDEEGQDLCGWGENRRSVPGCGPDAIPEGFGGQELGSGHRSMGTTMT